MTDPHRLPSTIRFSTVELGKQIISDTRWNGYFQSGDLVWGLYVKESETHVPSSILAVGSVNHISHSGCLGCLVTEGGVMDPVTGDLCPWGIFGVGKSVVSN